MVVCGSVIDNHTPVNHAGMKNSVGYQISLLQNFVNRRYLGRINEPVQDAYIENLGAEAAPTSGIYARYIRVPDGEFTASSGNFNVDTTNMSLVSSGAILRANQGQLSLTASNGNISVTSNAPTGTVTVSANSVLVEASESVQLLASNSTGTIVAKNTNIELRDQSIYGSGHVITDDWWTILTPDNDRGIVAINADFGGAIYTAMFAYDKVYGSIQEMCSYGDWGVEQPPLYGTGGALGKASVAIDASGIYLENRLGSTKTFGVTFIGV